MPTGLLEPSTRARCEAFLSAVLKEAERVDPARELSVHCFSQLAGGVLRLLQKWLSRGYQHPGSEASTVTVVPLQMFVEKAQLLNNSLASWAPLRHRQVNARTRGVHEAWMGWNSSLCHPFDWEVEAFKEELARSALNFLCHVVSWYNEAIRLFGLQIAIHYLEAILDWVELCDLDEILNLSQPTQQGVGEDSSSRDDTEWQLYINNLWQKINTTIIRGRGEARQAMCTLYQDLRELKPWLEDSQGERESSGSCRSESQADYSSAQELTDDASIGSRRDSSLASLGTEIEVISDSDEEAKKSPPHLELLHDGSKAKDGETSEPASIYGSGESSSDDPDSSDDNSTPSWASILRMRRAIEEGRIDYLELNEEVEEEEQELGLRSPQADRQEGDRHLHDLRFQGGSEDFVSFAIVQDRGRHLQEPRFQGGCEDFVSFSIEQDFLMVV